MTARWLLRPSNLIARQRHEGVIFGLLGAGLWCLYAVVFATTMTLPLAAAMLAALANVVPLIGLAMATRKLLRVQEASPSFAARAVRQVAFAVGFASLWYGGILVLSAFLRGLAGHGFAVHGFSAIAFTWQVFQGLAIYALVAVTAGRARLRDEAAEPRDADNRPLRRYLTRAGKVIRPVNVDEIVMIAGAQDYSEVTTRDGRHLVRLSLGEFERRLDPGQFFRIHRSALINLEHLERLEPAGGGRMTAHLSTGESVEVSRSGAQLLRSFMV